MKRITDVCLVASFLLVLFLPIAAKEMSLGVQTQEMLERENRVLPKRPSLFAEKFRYRDVKRFPERMESYLTDTLPLRSQMIARFMRGRHKLFGRQYANGIVGKDGWLFYNAAPGSETVDDFLGHVTLSERNFIQIFDKYNQRRLRFKSLGAEYYALIAPNKVTIYPEFLPDALQTARGKSCREQFMRRYREHIAGLGIPDFIIDPVDALRAQKAEAGILYYPQDTHWNWTGRILAGRIILDRLRGAFPDIGAIPDLKMYRRAGLDDLVTILNIETTPEQRGTFLIPDESQWAGMDISHEGNDHVYRNADGGGEAILLVGDSFLHGFLPLPEAFAFKTAIFHQGAEDALPVFEKYGKQEHIGIVIEEHVERRFFER